MPDIFDNINKRLQDAILLRLSEAVGTVGADFCVGYFNLRGWDILAGSLDHWTPGQEKMRLLVGMARTDRVWKKTDADNNEEALVDNETKIRGREAAALEFRRQLSQGVPSNHDEAALKQLLSALEKGQLEVRLFLRYPLHAKLYLIHRNDSVTPLVGYLGSSNLTYSGLTGQGELNIDVVEQDAAHKLSAWFEDRWQDSLDISKELKAAIQESWAVAEPGPYLIYLKILYHLSREAQLGLAEYSLPKDFTAPLFDFQAAAVRIAARMLNREGGLILGDVVGLGKTLMGTALAKIFDEDFGYDALIICPKNLIAMWEAYKAKYRLRAKVLSLSAVTRDLKDLRRYQLLIIDESHNLRNSQGQRYQAIKDYIEQNESKCLLLSATPYNKSYEDLAGQLGLFLKDDQDLGLRPERLLNEVGEREFLHRFNISPQSLAAFRKSEYPEDWQDLMRRFMIRRTRSFIKENYAKTDPKSDRKYLDLADGGRSWFPARIPKTIAFPVDENDPNDQLARLFNEKVVDGINDLKLPRYGLKPYLKKTLPKPNSEQERILNNLSRAGGRLLGFCRIGLLKRLESSGRAFIWSIQRHALRNGVLIYALKNNLDIPIGPQEAQLIDPYFCDDDSLGFDELPFISEEGDFESSGARLYASYQTGGKFGWLAASFFTNKLLRDLQADNRLLSAMLHNAGPWQSFYDKKLAALKELLQKEHPDKKVLVFTQFADTVNYLADELKGLGCLAGVTGQSEDPTDLASRFSPKSNEYTMPAGSEEYRVLISTDVLSEGQNLQDAAIVVNYDLPWAIIRLIQRAGRVDRIGQAAENILCYSFLPAEKVEALINLRARVLARLKENAEVVGADEVFFEEPISQTEYAARVLDLYHEKSEVLEEHDERGVDISSYALALWKAETKGDHRLENAVKKLPPVVNATRHISSGQLEGVVVYARQGENMEEGRSLLAFLDAEGRVQSESPFKILEMVQCAPGEPGRARRLKHHEITGEAVRLLENSGPSLAGALGTAASVRYKVYNRLKPLVANHGAQTLLDAAYQELLKAHEAIYLHELSTEAKLILKRQLRHGLTNADLAELVINLYQEGRLIRPETLKEHHAPSIICSLGLWAGEEA